jgi:SAM-dependent methyltransferase
MKASCPLCRIQARHCFRSTDHNRKITGEYFDYYRCPSCELIFLSPIPDDLAKYYPTEYYAVPASHEQLEKEALRDRYKIDIVRRFAAQGRLLEIGPSRGKFALLAKNAGYEVEVLERDRDCCVFLRDTIGIKAIHGDDPEEGLKDTDNYDVIALWHVIEHLPEPWKALRTISEKLSPGGILVISTPNPRAFQFRMLKSYWTHVDAPRHLSLIPLALLRKQAQLQGLVTLWSTTRDKGSLECNRSGWKDSLENAAGRGSLRKKYRKLGRLMSVLAVPIEYLNGMGSAYTVVFRKEM